MRLKSIVEAGMGATEYRVPSDPQVLMADFYLMELLRSGGQKYTPSHRSDLIDQEIEHVDSVLLPGIREHMLSVVGYAIAGELAHIFDMASSKLGPGQKYASYGEKWATGWIGDRLPERAVGLLAASAASGMLFSADEILPYLDDLVPLAKRAFSELEWANKFGGTLWARACDLWFSLRRSRSGTEIVMAIDLIYQAQHNTGSLLNKDERYKGSWLHAMLNLKYEASRPQDMMAMASPYVRRLASMVLRNRHGESHSEPRTMTVRDKQLKDAVEALERMPQTENVELSGDSVFFVVNGIACSLNTGATGSTSDAKGRNYYVVYSAVGPHYCDNASGIPGVVNSIDALSSKKKRVDYNPLAKLNRR